jgi:predicted amidohydrolase
MMDFAFSADRIIILGYNFKTLQQIHSFLEPSGSGISSLWARTTALKFNTKVLVGYPEKVDISKNWPTSPEYYDSAIMVNEEGETVLNYRKNFLHGTDQTWALEGPGFFCEEIDGLGKVCVGVGMDLKYVTTAVHVQHAVGDDDLF